MFHYTYEEFKQELIEIIKESTDKKVAVSVQQENGVYMDTIALIGDDQIAGSVAYIKDSYQDYCNGASMVAVARKVLELCEW